MIGVLFAQQQVDRLLGLKCFVAGEHKQSAITEMVTAMQSAEDVAAAMAFVNDWVNEQDEWPTPAQIRRILWETHDKLHKITNTCQVCNGTGMRIVTRVVKGIEYSGAKDCECRKVLV